MALAVSYRGNLNDAEINHGLWVGRDGPVSDLAGTFGSIAQTFKLIDWMIGHAFRLQEALRNSAVQAAQELVKLNEQKQNLEASIRVLRTDQEKIRSSWPDDVGR